MSEDGPITIKNPHVEIKPLGNERLKQKEPKPRRYEVRDAETGEKLSGVSFILTPTGEEMHRLGKKVHIGPLKAGVYYEGNPEDAPGPADRGPTIVKGMALYLTLLDNLRALVDHMGSRDADAAYRWIQDINTQTNNLLDEYLRRLEEEHGTDENPTA